jgi:hypothetical protein
MKYILLCGGSGKRLTLDTGFPKPLNHVLGIQSLEYILEGIPSNDIYIIINKDLKEYNFDTIVEHLTKKNITYTYLERYTRGPVETAYLGIKNLFDNDEQICFFDNDTIYNLNDTVFPKTSFIGYCNIDTNENLPYCYLDISGNKLINIKEKQRISNSYGCGIYGFQTKSLFMNVAKELIYSNNTYKNEFYMSSLYNILLNNNDNIETILVKSTVCIGTPSDINNSITKIPFKQIRICFDIDNTILKYRKKNETYKECKEIDKITYLLKELKKKGHIIILYTARGMKTQNSNLGSLMKYNAIDTFEVLEKYGIEYDEIYFGKPHADLYIDDKAFNPYLNLYDSIGFQNILEEYNRTKVVSNSTNKFNLITKKSNRIIKKGPSSSMVGEIFFYNSIQDREIQYLFPEYISSHIHLEEAELTLGYVQGFTLYELLKDELLTKEHILLVLNKLDELHNSKGTINISKDDIYNNYIGKLKKRILNKNEYPFENTNSIVDHIDTHLKKYLFKEYIYPSTVVHGDPWFSNTLLTIDNKIIFLDMKGDINGKLTTNGDALTDFGKIYQSLLGFDAIINNTYINESYMDELKDLFMNEMKKRNYSITDLYSVTACLISKTLSFLDVNISTRTKIWNIVEDLVECL